MIEQREKKLERICEDREQAAQREDWETVHKLSREAIVISNQW